MFRSSLSPIFFLAETYTRTSLDDIRSLLVQSDSSYAVPSVLHVVCNTLVGAYVSFWMVYDFSMEWSYRVRYVRFVGHVIPAL